MLPLAFAELNKEVTIKDIRGTGCCKGQLLEKGFCIGKKLCVLKDGNGGVVVKMNNCKYALNFDLASKIIVEI